MKRSSKKLKWVPGLMNDVPDSWSCERKIYVDGHTPTKSGLRKFCEYLAVCVLLGVFWAMSESVLANSSAEPLSNSDYEAGSALWLRLSDSHLDATGSQAVIPAIALATDVSMQVNGPILRARVRQVFSNPSSQWAEGIYSFPLPVNATVDLLEMKSDGIWIKGEIKEKQLAQKIYQSAKHSGHKTSLLNHHRTNVFTTSVANIAPGESLEIVFEYQQMVDYHDGRFRLRFPMVNTPKYVPNMASGKHFDLPSPINLMRRADEEDANPVSIQVALNSGIPIEDIRSISHSVNVTRGSESEYRIQLDGNAAHSNRDFLLSWSPIPSDQTHVAMLHEIHESEVYGLMMVVPSNGKPESDSNRPPLDFWGGRIEPAALFSDSFHSGKTQADYLEPKRAPIQRDRELILVLDVSGSMQGESIRQAKTAVLHALAELKPEDRFNIIFFNDRADQIFERSRLASPKYLSRARQVLLARDANGGTEMRQALNLALDRTNLSMNDEVPSLRQVVFITDGAVGNEHQLFSDVQRMLEDSRLFTVGIGSAPNSYFMRKAAVHGKGSYTYIANPKEAGPKIKALLLKLNRPAITDLKVDLAGLQAEVFPETLPDVYVGEPVYLSFRLAQLPEVVTFTGMNGRDTVRLKVPLDHSESHQQKATGIAKYWASRKVDALRQQERVLQTDPEGLVTLRQDIISTALSHQIVSPYTSLVAVDHWRSRHEEALKSQRIAANRPKGWGGTVPLKLAQTDAGLYPLLVTFLISLVLVVWMGCIQKKSVVSQ